MRRLASQRLLNALTDELLAFHLAQLDDDGYVTDIQAFSSETASTSYANGLIVISAAEVNIVLQESFRDFRQRIHSLYGGPTTTSTRCYVITPFNLADMEFTPQSRIFSL